MAMIIHFLVKLHRYLAVYVVLFGPNAVKGHLGFNWGRMATQRMIPSMVVDIMLQNNIRYVKTFSASRNVLEAFGGTGIQVDISLPNSDLKIVNTTLTAESWISERIKPFLDLNVTFRNVHIGTHPSAMFLPEKIQKQAILTVDLIQRSLKDNNIAGVKATIAHYLDDIIDLNITRPSMSEIKPKQTHNIIEFCKIIRRTKAPFGIDMFPLATAMVSYNKDIEFAFFDNNSSSKFWDGEFFYNNIFEVMYDSIASALEKLGFPDLEIFVGSVGWPTDGMQGANLRNAERFHQGLAKFVKSQKGTPRRPGNVDVYILNIADENAVPATGIPFNRHWGIYKFDGQPKFNLDFTGNGRKVKPVSAVGITHMPKRWCILDSSKINPNLSKINPNFSRIPFEELDAYYNSSCIVGDCSSASPGGSCSGLSFPLNYSYGFNAGFQALKQNVKNHSCEYGGYGILVFDDPSTSGCTFPIEIIAAETKNFLGISIGLTLRPCLALPIFVVVQFIWILIGV